jgi:hypothetical protein
MLALSLPEKISYVLVSLSRKGILLLLSKLASLFEEVPETQEVDTE